MFRSDSFPEAVKYLLHQQAQRLHKKAAIFHEGIKSGLCLVWMHHCFVEVISCLFHSACVVHSCCYYSCQLPGSPWNQSESTQPNTFSTLLIKVRSPNYLGSITSSIEGGKITGTTYNTVLYNEIMLQWLIVKPLFCFCCVSGLDSSLLSILFAFYLLSS